MCGIVGAVSQRNIVPVLVQGLERLEYRGYDSCGVAVYAQGADAAHSGLRRARSTAMVPTPTKSPGALRWCTTASLKTTTPCAPPFKPRVTCF